MTKKQIKKLLSDLSDELNSVGINGEVGVVGGAAMVLGFNAREATKDVDAIFEPAEKVRKAAAAVGRRNNIDTDWLNDAVKGFLPRPEARLEKTVVFQTPSLLVWVPDPRYMFAMKAMSARAGTKDTDDLMILIKAAGINSAKDGIDLIADYYPDRIIPTKTKFFIEETFQKMGIF
ncbi:MAG: hypothetical protein HY537_14830 [Deltaproteobacteria bacterium]|nr:hypothetical protein [Deltaproteobacteria bacterium]